MSSLSPHIADTPDLLAPDAVWRQELADVAEKFTVLLPKIKNILNRSGGEQDQIQFQQDIPKLSRILVDLNQRLQTSMDELKKSKAEWDQAIENRTGRLADFDSEVKVREADLTNLRSQFREQESKLQTLKQHSGNPQTSLTSVRAEEDSTRQGQVAEAKRLKELDERYCANMGDLSRRYQDLNARETSLELRESVWMEKEGERKAALDARERVLDQREKDVDARELGLTEERDTEKRRSSPPSIDLDDTAKSPDESSRVSKKRKIGHNTLGDDTGADAGSRSERWAVDDVLSRGFGTTNVPRRIIARVTEQMATWSEKKPDWAESSERRCAASIVAKKGTRIAKGKTAYACKSCTDKKRVCVAV
ncbi:hypothetical protein P7C71_g2925, partial [Lecanoromycetidae sp. Uapishka_2]